MQERKESLGMLKNVQFGQENFTFLFFKRLVSDLFHTASAMVESQSIKR